MADNVNFTLTNAHLVTEETRTAAVRFNALRYIISADWDDTPKMTPAAARAEREGIR